MAVNLIYSQILQFLLFDEMNKQKNSSGSKIKRHFEFIKLESLFFICCTSDWELIKHFLEEIMERGSFIPSISKDEFSQFTLTNFGAVIFINERAYLNWISFRIVDKFFIPIIEDSQNVIFEAIFFFYLYIFFF